VKHLVWITAIVLATLIALYLAWQLRAVVVLFLFSLATAAAIRPVVDFLHRWIARPVALGLSYLLLIALIVGPFLVFASPLLTDLKRLGEDAVQGYQELSKRWSQGTSLQQTVARRLPVPEHVVDQLAIGQARETLAGVLGFTFGLFGVAVNVLIVIVLSLYWSIDRIHFERLWLSLLSVDQRTEARSLWRDVEDELGGYLRSEIVQAVAAAFLLAIGFHLIQYPYPVLLALIAAACWLIPWLGLALAICASLLFTLPLGAVSGFRDPLLSAMGAAVLTLAVLLALEAWVEPRLFRRRHYNPFVMVIVVVALADVFGIFGLILGPPLAAAIQIAGNHLLHWRLERQSRLRALELPALEERVAAVRAALSSLRDPPAGLVSLVERLELLLGEVQTWSQSPAAAPSMVQYSSSAPSAVS
jgi:putative permease